jgi:hypothetical protein
MKLLLALSLLLALPRLAPARVGDSLEELKRRYGRPLEITGSKTAPTSHAAFQRDRLRIAVTLTDGLSVSEEFTRRDGQDFTLQEVRILLAENATSPGASWRQTTATTWLQRDRTATWAGRALLVESRWGR